MDKEILLWHNFVKDLCFFSLKFHLLYYFEMGSKLK